MQTLRYLSIHPNTILNLRTLKGNASSYSLALVNRTRLSASMFVEIGIVFPKQKEAHSLLKINERSCEYPISCDIRTAIYSLAFRQCSVGPNLCHLQAHRGSNRGKAPFCASTCWFVHTLLICFHNYLKSILHVKEVNMRA